MLWAVNFQAGAVIHLGVPTLWTLGWLLELEVFFSSNTDYTQTFQFNSLQMVLCMVLFMVWFMIWFIGLWYIVLVILVSAPRSPWN